MEPIDKLLDVKMGAVDISCIYSPKAKPDDISLLAQLVAERKIKVKVGSFERAAAEGAHLFSVESDMGVVSLYHPTPSVPTLSLPTADRFTTLFDLLVKLETSELPDKLRQFHVWPQLMYDEPRRLPTINDPSRMYIMAARPPIPDDHHDGGFAPFPITEMFGMRMAAGPHAIIKLFRESKGSGCISFAVAEKIAELGLYCAVCGKQEGLMKCSGCKREYFCGEAHQKEAWKAHAKLYVGPPNEPETRSRSFLPTLQMQAAPRQEHLEEVARTSTTADARSVLSSPATTLRLAILTDSSLQLHSTRCGPGVVGPNRLMGRFRDGHGHGSGWRFRTVGTGGPPARR